MNPSNGMTVPVVGVIGGDRFSTPPAPGESRPAGRPMLVGVLLRAATPADLPDLLDLQEAGAVRALAHIFPQDEYPFPRADVAARWAAETADPGIDVWVAEHDGRLAGFVAVRGDELLHFGTAVGTWG